MDSEVKTPVSMAEALFDAAMGALVQAEKAPTESLTRMNYLLQAIADAMLGGLRDGLDYAAKQADRVEPDSPIYPGPEFEEDTTRP